MNSEVTVMRVFTDADNNFGNPVGIIVDETRQLNSRERQTIARNLDFSETVFVDSIADRTIQIFSPLREVSFAGHAVLGAAAYFGVTREKYSIRTSSKAVFAWYENVITWIETDLQGLPDWNFIQFANEKEIEGIDSHQAENFKHTFAWAYCSEVAGKIRARTSASDWGIPEDEANGSGAMLLAAQMNKALTFQHGQGSVMYAEPVGTAVKLGGRVEGE